MSDDRTADPWSDRGTADARSDDRTEVEGSDDQSDARTADVDSDHRTVNAMNDGGTDDDPAYRVLAVSEDGSLHLLDRETYEPVVTAAEGHGAPIANLRPGYLVDADLDWSAAEPTVESLSVRRPTLYAFADHIDPVFEAAQEAWADARAQGDAMNSRVTRNTDNEVNGVLYVFAEDRTDATFEAFRDGTRPLEPLVDKVNDGDGTAPREVFVLRPADGRFVVVTIALRKGGRFADVLRETYDLPRPTEPMA